MNVIKNKYPLPINILTRIVYDDHNFDELISLSDLSNSHKAIASWGFFFHKIQCILLNNNTIFNPELFIESLHLPFNDNNEFNQGF